MKRPLFIIIGAIVILILLCVWVYVLFFGTPENMNDGFADFNFGNTTDPSYVPGGDTDTVSSEPIVNVAAPKRLKQLTTKPIAGYGEVSEGNIPKKVLYVEAGVGHIFSIDLETGEEQRVSATTLPSSQVASFAGNGEFVMIQTGFGNKVNFTVGELSSDSTELITSTIDEKIISFTGTPSGRFLYAVQTNNSVIGKVFNPTTLAKDILFTVPFRDATIVWGKEASDSHYVYPKATSRLEGFLYEIKNGALSRLPIDGYGLSATGNNDYIFYSKQTADEYRSFSYMKEDENTTSNQFVQIPEKCTFSSVVTSMAVCANTATDYNNQMPDSWYSGGVTYSDTLYQFLNDVGRSIRLVDTQNESGQNLDIVNLSLGAQDANVYFTNRNDQILWMYEITPAFLLTNN